MYYLHFKEMQKLIVSVLAVLIASSVPIIQKKVNLFFMKFFRDVARVKARNRRMNSKSLITMGDLKSIILDKEDDPLTDVVDQIMSSQDLNQDRDNSDLPIFSREELFQYNGTGDFDAIYISILGRVYDVTAGKRFYGPGGKYHIFAGREVTKALATGCLREDCIGSNTSFDNADEIFDIDLNDKTMQEAKKWMAFFETHDKYMLVGLLKDSLSIEGLIDIMVQRELETEIQNAFREKDGATDE